MSASLAVRLHRVGPQGLRRLIIPGPSLKSIYMTRTRFGCTLPSILEQQRTPRYDKKEKNYARRQT